MTDDQKRRSLHVKVNDAFVSDLDVWRGKQSDCPTRSEAIRRLVEIALGDETAAKRLIKEEREMLAREYGKDR
jgi:Arc/MetJ-type ribon-helix-helix transcriptional regulator